MFLVVGNIGEKYTCQTLYFGFLSHSDPFDTSNDYPLKHTTHCLHIILSPHRRKKITYCSQRTLPFIHFKYKTLCPKRINVPFFKYTK